MQLMSPYTVFRAKCLKPSALLQLILVQHLGNRGKGYFQFTGTKLWYAVTCDLT